MTEAEIEKELQNLQGQLLLLQVEHAKTRNGWRYWLRMTGFLLLVFSIAIFTGLLKSHGDISSNPVGVTLMLIAIFMLTFALWLIAWSVRRLAERLMTVAPER